MATSCWSVQVEPDLFGGDPVYMTETRWKFNAVIILGQDYVRLLDEIIMIRLYLYYTIAAHGYCT